MVSFLALFEHCVKFIRSFIGVARIYRWTVIDHEHPLFTNRLGICNITPNGMTVGIIIAQPVLCRIFGEYAKVVEITIPGISDRFTIIFCKGGIKAKG